MIPRADLAAVLVQSLGRSELYGRTFEVQSTRAAQSVNWEALFAGLEADTSVQIPGATRR
jgi:hypothetical protein